ncbi:CsbD family protein [Diaphorobacter aerolatus]|uniref:CsbD family protein n=1 Tax=Diaphorobacter aerolatus TaxID=1288495 RepID=A0A7H0GH99_9BURK|nr:CsbD family protein [Diaphorobacter aerolatus]QNP47665.1 CsbD family protein [Diaphorobacter aerolatus]
MKKEQVTGRLEEAKGAVKEVVGKAVGNTKMQVEGNVEKNAGKAEAAAGDLANKVEKVVKK